mmetsp:Transcript_29019/g.42369  ORF Transcript_29019/g.42369 Transcript_29019/m.42369 type:complete len:810 (-) Transcript_29019:266-2695(-)
MGNCSSKTPAASVPATKPSGGTPPPPPQSDAAKPEPSARQMATPSVREKLIGLHAKAQKNKLGEDGEEKASTTRQGEDTRLQVIFAAPIEIDPNFEPPVHEKTHEQAEFINLALASNFIFSNLEEEERNTLINAMDEYSVVAGDDIIKQGDIGDYFYVIESGSVKFTVDGAEVGKAKSGDGFGELALLYNCPRAATCTAEEACDLWRVDQDTFRKILASQTISNNNEVKELLRKVSFLSDLDDRFINRLIDALTVVTFEKNELIVRKGDEGNVFYIIKSGKVKVSDIEIGDAKYVDQELGVGEFFGERALITSEPRVANITAVESCTALALSKEIFTKVLGNLNEAILKTQDIRKLKGIPIFANSKVLPNELSALANFLKEVEYEEGANIFTEGETVDPALYIIRSGKVTIASKSGVNVLTSGAFFGEDTLVTEEGATSVTANNTATCTEKCVLGALSLASLEEVIGDTSRLGKLEQNTGKLDTSVKYEDLNRHKILGSGTFGQVWLCSSKTDKTKVYALKIQNKRELLGHHQVDGVLREKAVMASLDHVFVIKLVNTFQDEKSLYMLLKLVQGGELFSILHTSSRDGVKESSAKFYAACILKGLAYMHDRHILYRDLKPENVLIDSTGYCVIVDLGFAKVVMDKTYTLCGTPLYLAPEVILSRGHDKGADYWSLGVLIYEMIFGGTPFFDNHIDQITLFKRIVRGQFMFPPVNSSSESQDLIKRLMEKRPTERLGTFAKGHLDISEHPWFAGIDFNKVQKKEMKAPWVPKIKNALDVGHFDSWDHLEDATKKKSQPLSPREQKKFEGF